MNLITWLSQSAVGTFIRHNIGLVVAFCLCGLLAGCAFFPVKVSDPLDPTKQISEYQLQAHIDVGTAQLEQEASAVQEKMKEFQARVAASNTELQAKENAIASAINTIGTLVASTGAPGAGLAATIVPTILAGLFYDNRRKDAVIAQKSSVTGGSAG